MKKEKGFTLIELLAVIIILGILMMVAIPAVTTYINSSRKSAYLDTAKQLVSAAQTAVSSNKGVTFYDEQTLLLIPVGPDEEKSFIQVEKGGQSPYSSTYHFAYVGVVYDGETESHKYYFTAVDSAGQGIKFTSLKDIESKDDKVVQSGLRSKTKCKYAAELHSKYDTPEASQISTIAAPYTDLLKDAGLDGKIGGDGPNKDENKIKYILICSNEKCPSVKYDDET